MILFLCQVHNTCRLDHLDIFTEINIFYLFIFFFGLKSAKHIHSEGILFKGAVAYKKILPNPYVTEN